MVTSKRKQPIDYANRCVAVTLMLICSIASGAEHELLSMPVRVVTSSGSDLFPESWRSAPIRATGEALADSQFERVSIVLKRCFSKYPEEFLKEHLKKVYVLSALRYSGVSAAGTNSRTAVYLKVREVNDGFTDTFIEDTFHAELSSILLRNRAVDFDAEVWQKLNPEDFEYSSGRGVGAIKAGKASLRTDKDLHAQGFRNQYAQSSLENDFNDYAGALFTGDKMLWELAEKHDAIKGKLTLTIAFYHRLDPSWTEERFRMFVQQ